MLEISKEFQETTHVQVTIRFCINVNGHEISGAYTDSSDESHVLNWISVEFDDPEFLYESGTFTHDEVDEIQEWIEHNIELPKI
jgi:uncharacterized protein (DUF736 family)